MADGSGPGNVRDSHKGATDFSERPIWKFIEAAQAQRVSQESAWLMWRAVFPRATRSIFRDEWREVAAWMSGAPL